MSNTNLDFDRSMRKANRQADRELRKLYREYGSVGKDVSADKDISVNKDVLWGSIASFAGGTPLGAFITAGNIANNLINTFDKGIDIINPDVAKRSGMSEWEQGVNKVMKAIPFGEVFGLVTKPLENFKINDATLKIGSGYGGAMQKMYDAEAFSGARLLAGKKSGQNTIDLANKYNNSLANISYQNDRLSNNMFGQLQLIQNQINYAGGYQPTALKKHGGTIPELDEVRSIMKSLQSKKQDIQSEEPQKFQLGGKMNMIVTGALHARKHNLEELNPNLEGEITKKGIPVVVMNEGGEVQSQQAEVESQELVLQIDTTKTIEDYYDEYNSTDSKTEKNRIALECGKFLVNELLKNTDDPDKLIKKTL